MPLNANKRGRENKLAGSPKCAFTMPSVCVMREEATFSSGIQRSKF